MATKVSNGLTINFNKRRRLEPDYDYFNALIERTAKMLLAIYQKRYNEAHPYPNDENFAQKDFENSLLSLDLTPNNPACLRVLKTFDEGYKKGVPLDDLLHEACRIISKSYEEFPSGSPREDELKILHNPNKHTIYEHMVMVYVKRRLHSLFIEQLSKKPKIVESNKKETVLRLLDSCNADELSEILAGVLEKVGWRSDMKYFVELLIELEKKFWIEKINPKQATTLSLAFTETTGATIYQYFKDHSQVYTTRFKPCFKEIKINKKRKSEDKKN